MTRCHPARRPRRLLLAAPVVAAGLLALLPTAAPAATVDVNIADNAFQPNELIVDAGDTVRWTQTGTRPHTVTADDGSFDSSPAGSPNLSQGSTFSQAFASAGTFRYYCKIHGGPGGVGMSGTITVRAQVTTTTSTTAAPTTTTAAPATTTTAAPATTTTTAGARVAGTSAQLPRTGAPLLPLAGAGAALVAVGGVLSRARRRPRRSAG